MNARKGLAGIVLALALGAGVPACGSSGTSSAPKTPTPAAFSSPSRQSVIAANWTAFFNPKTPAGKRTSLLQDGQEFAAVIESQASSPLAASATAEVTKVRLISAKDAKVTYSILENGQPVLPRQIGISVYQDGTWKVGSASFCSLLALENGRKTSTLPAACKAAG